MNLEFSILLKSRGTIETKRYSFQEHTLYNVFTDEINVEKKLEINDRKAESSEEIIRALHTCLNSVEHPIVEFNINIWEGLKRIRIIFQNGSNAWPDEFKIYDENGRMTMGVSGRREEVGILEKQLELFSRVECDIKGVDAWAMEQ